VERDPLSPAGRIRIAARMAAVLVLLAGSLALYYLWRPLPRPNPWPRRFLGGMAWLAGARVRTRGALPPRGAIILANHVSWLDILILAGATGTAFVAHAGLAENRVLKWLCDMNDTVFVSRGQRSSVAGQVGQVRDALADEGLLTIFPEGTTGDGRTLLPFKSSLLSALEPAPRGVVVQPVWIDYRDVAAAIAWGDEAGLANFYRILARSGTFAVNVHFAAPFAPADAGGRKAIAAEARRRIDGLRSAAVSPAAGIV
jgi:1-acyl-sn-glycerol-3-phosphate acyltransferase